MGIVKLPSSDFDGSPSRLSSWTAQICQLTSRRYLKIFQGRTDGICRPSSVRYTIGTRVNALEPLSKPRRHPDTPTLREKAGSLISIVPRSEPTNHRRMYERKGQYLLSERVGRLSAAPANEIIDSCQAARLSVGDLSLSTDLHSGGCSND